MRLSDLKNIAVRFDREFSKYRKEKADLTAGIARSQNAVLSDEREESNRIRSAIQDYQNQVTAEKERREKSIARARYALQVGPDGLQEKNWQKVKQGYYSTAHTSVLTTYTGRSPETLLRNLEDMTTKMNQMTGQLNSAFISPGVAGFVGSISPTFRQEDYRAIAELRENMLRCMAALQAQTDLSAREQAIRTAQDVQLRKLRQATQARLARFPLQAQEKLAQLNEGITQLGETVSCILSPQPVRLGYLMIEDPKLEAVQALPGNYAQHLTCDGLSIPVGVSRLNQNFLFDTDFQMTPFFGAVALDILNCQNTKVIFADVAGIGGNYRDFSRLEQFEQVKILRTEDQLIQALEQLQQDISFVCRNRLTAPLVHNIEDYNERYADAPLEETYLFVDQLMENISPRAVPLLASIVNNGGPAGFHVVMGLRSAPETARQEKELLFHLKDVKICQVNNCSISLAPTVTLLMLRDVNSDLISKIYRRLLACHDKKAVLSLGPQLPQRSDWQKASSAEALSLPFGVDSVGHVVSLVFGKNCPYGLIIGDVGSGKSSLLQAVILQALCRYSPEELQIAVGDFKNGAEFSVYAEQGVPAVKAVVVSREKDVMASFIKHYADECTRRQKLFDALHRQTGRMVRNYEGYREICRDLKLARHCCPRILIIVDEYRELFQANSETSQAMSQLVQMGRTYGIHLLMASQRSVSDDPKNTFSPELRSFFTSRFVFHTTQRVARDLLSERCADTNRESNGIASAPRLETGHAVYNWNSGETEADNCWVQCFYSSDDLIQQVCTVLTVGGREHGDLIVSGQPSLTCQEGNPERICLGQSPLMGGQAGGFAEADHQRLISLAPTVRNLVCTGSDSRVAASCAASAIRHLQAAGQPFRVHVFGQADSPLVQLLCGYEFTLHETQQSVHEELARQVQNPAPVLNLFAEITDYPALSQSASGLRTSPEAALLRQVLSGTGINIVRAESYRELHSGYAQVEKKAQILLFTPADEDALRCALPAGCPLPSAGAFEEFHDNAINAYYLEKLQNHFGKVVLFRI